jgi:hypothetical protein
MTIKAVFLSVFGVFLLAAWMRNRASNPVSTLSSATPVLVELFTSEGCSSCPPADKFLEKLDQQPVSGAEIIVLSEHVDYWNHSGWRDPYSAHSYSERQTAYAERFHLDSVYTPQMVVDGTNQFVGSDTAAADRVFAKAKARLKIPVHLSLISAVSPTVKARVEVGTLDASFGVHEAELYIAVALNRAQSQVSAGENAGQQLEHAAVLRSLTKVGVINEARSLSQDVELPLDPGLMSRDLRLVAFVQEHRQGRVLGAFLLSVQVK